MLTFIGNRLKPAFYLTQAYIYRQGDEINTFKFVIEGMAALVQPRYNNAIFAVIDPNLAKPAVLGSIESIKNLHQKVL